LFRSQSEDEVLAVGTPRRRREVRFGEFVTVDVELGVRVKYMSFVDFTRGKTLCLEAEKMLSNPDAVETKTVTATASSTAPTSPITTISSTTSLATDQSVIRLLELAVKSFEAALISDPLNVQTKRDAYFARRRLEARQARDIGQHTRADTEMLNAIEYAVAIADHGGAKQLVSELKASWTAIMKSGNGRMLYGTFDGASTALTRQRLTHIVDSNPQIFLVLVSAQE